MDSNFRGQRNSSKNRNKHQGHGKTNSNQNDSHRTLSAKELLLPQKRPPHHSSLPLDVVKHINEPLETCHLCGQVIQNIAEAITDAEGKYCHFDCVIEQLKHTESLTEKQSVSYVGSGCFAVVERQENGSYTIVKRIVYEKPEVFSAMKKYVEAVKVI